MFELRINNDNCSFEPITQDGVLYESFGRGRCSKLSFDILGERHPLFSVREGDKVSLRAGGRNLFFGVVFQRRKRADGSECIVAYDQLRYLKNKDTYVYYDMRASDVVRMIANDYRLRLGDVEPTLCVIPYRIEDNVSLLDIIENALDFELQHSGRRFTLLDMFGNLSLCGESQMESGTVLNRNTIGECGLASSIENRCNRVKVSRYDRSSGRRDVFVANDSDSENKIGVLQLYERVGDKNVHLPSRAFSLLAMRNVTQKNIFVKNAMGDVNVRGGSRVMLDLDDYYGYATVAGCVHRFSANSHLMDLTINC